MASYHQIQHHSRAPFESPAKIFAKLKSKLKRPTVEDFSDDECRVAEFHGAQFTPKRRTQSHDMDKSEDFSPPHGLGNGEVTAVTLSPISSPQKSLQCRTDCKLLYGDETGHAFNHACMPRRRPFMESTAVFNTTAPQAHDAFNTRTADPGDLENAGPPHFISPNSVFSPIRKRLRKRKSDNQLLNKSNNMMSDMDCVRYPEKEKKIIPAFREDEHITSKRNVEPFSQEFTVTPEHPVCSVETLSHSLKNPAKMFAYLKERENQRDLCDVPQDSFSPRPEVDQDIQSEVRMGLDSAVSTAGRPQSPDDGATDEDFIHDSASDVPSQPVLLEDPLVLNSPRISIPKTQEPVCRRTKWSHCVTFPTENVIHLRKWFIRGSRKGLFVDGIHRENNLPWNSNIISDRVSNSVLKTVSGRVYILVGKMDSNAPSQFPKWFLKGFVNGFPSNWKELHEKYLSESKRNLKKRSGEQNEKRGQRLKASMNQSLKQQQQKTSPLCPSSSASSIKVSRSGRLIKQPLDYWKGGRVILDAHMNVTIHDSYDTTVLQPEITNSVSTKSFISSNPDKQTALVMVPLKNVCEQSNPKHQLQRKVKTPQRKPRQNKSTAIQKPPTPQNTMTTDQVTRSSKNCPTTEKNSEDAESQEFKNTKTKVSKANTVKVRQRSASSQRSPPGNIGASSQPSTNKEKVFRKTTDKCADKSQMNVRTRPSRSSQSSNSSQESETCTRKLQTKPLKNVKTPKRTTKTPSPKTAQAVTHKAAQSNRTRKRTARIKPVSEPDEDEWTEDELKKLHDAVSCHPKHITGYWNKVAMMVGTRSADECHKRHTSIRITKTASKCERKTKEQPLKEKANPVITARVGTLRRKQQVRDFLEAMPREDMDDVFSSAYMQSKRIEVQSMCTSEDHDFSVSDQEPLTPKPTGFPEAKTPQCLHITPGMMGSSSRYQQYHLGMPLGSAKNTSNYDDKYVFQLQKRMKNHYQFNVEKHAKKVKANLTPTASLKKTMRRCVNTENDTFVVWEMFPDKEEAQVDSGEEEDFYFSEND